MKSIRNLMIAAVFAVTLLAAGSFAGTASAHPLNSNNNYQKNHKVFVCKYVGKPGVDERLQTGQNPISVSTHAIQHNGWNGQIPGWFSDAQGRSYVIAYDNGQPEPSVSECPAPEGKPVQPPVTPPVTPPTTPSNPGQGGGGHVLAASTTAEVTPTAQLVNTGQSAWLNAIVGLTMIALTLAVARMPRKQPESL